MRRGNLGKILIRGVEAGTGILLHDLYRSNEHSL